jgi:transposase
MGNKRIEMRKVRELLRLKFEQNISARQAAKIIGIGKTAASQYISGFKASGLDISTIKALPDSELMNAINSKKELENVRYKELSGLFHYFEKELKRTGVTLQLLWDEYTETRSDYYGYSQFCHHYYLWRKGKKVSMRMEHKAGDKMFVDFTGKKLQTVNPATGEIIEFEVFVAVLGASQLSYIEAVPSQTKADWVMVNENAIRFYGGVPAAIVPDCLKSAVIKADKYEPQLNQTFNDFANHYQTVILPARALHPQDKSLAENFVRNAYTQIYAPLTNHVFFSVEELNTALWEQLDIFNRKNFQGKDHSRQQMFEEIEVSQLKPMPVDYYELKAFKECRVQYNHHIFLKDDKHYYSAPFQLTGKYVLVVYSARTVEVFFNNKRVATHMRDRQPYGYTTKEEHRPPTHKYVSEWSPQRFIKWGRKISPEVEQVITKILDSRKHPEQAYKSCMGLLSLAKKYDHADYIKACKKALQLNCTSYKFIKNTLTTKAFNLTDEQELELFKIPDHKNIRGKEMYN